MVVVLVETLVEDMVVQLVVQVVEDTVEDLVLVAGLEVEGMDMAVELEDLVVEVVVMEGLVVEMEDLVVEVVMVARMEDRVGVQ
jgi:hypothetical protein